MFTAFTTRSRPRWWRTAGVSLALAAAAPARGEPTSTGSVEVEVEGTRPHSSATARQRATSASVITGDRLVQPGTTAAQVLREAPGVQVTELGGLGAPATASVRGATAAQTPIYFGGMRVNDEVGGAANLADLPLFLIERIEIYRSHAPLFADRLGIGGAIFLEPRRARRDEVVTGAEFGSHGLRSGHVHGAAVGDRFVEGDASDPRASGVEGPFDGVLMAYGIRNLPDPDRGLESVRRLLSPGARAVFHEYSVRDSRARTLLWDVVAWGIIVPGGLVTARSADIYRYLHRSVRAFDGVHAFEARLARAGFEEVWTGAMDGWQRGIVHSFVGRAPA